MDIRLLLAVVVLVVVLVYIASKVEEPLWRMVLLGAAACGVLLYLFKVLGLY